MRRETIDMLTKITLSPRARAHIEKSFIERTIAEAWAEVEGHLPCYEGRAEFAVDALSEAGFAIVRKGDADNKRHEARWEDGLRNIVSILHGPRAPFEIDLIVEEVRSLRDIVQPISDETARRTHQMTFDEDSDGWTITGDPDAVERVMALIKKAEAAEAAEAGASRQAA